MKVVDAQYTELAKANRSEANCLILNILAAEPVDKKNGMIVHADGTIWNPGSGAGFYGYAGGAWVKLH